MNWVASVSSSGPYSDVIVRTTVFSSGASIEAMFSTKGAPNGSSGMISSKLKTTSSDVKGSPSCQVTPSRRCSVTSRLSSLKDQSSASIGMSSKSSDTPTRGSIMEYANRRSEERRVGKERTSQGGG